MPNEPKSGGRKLHRRDTARRSRNQKERPAAPQRREERRGFRTSHLCVLPASAVHRAGQKSLWRTRTREDCNRTPWWAGSLSLGRRRPVHLRWHHHRVPLHRPGEPGPRDQPHRQQREHLLSPSLPSNRSHLIPCGDKCPRTQWPMTRECPMTDDQVRDGGFGRSGLDIGGLVIDWALRPWALVICLPVAPEPFPLTVRATSFAGPCD